MSKISTYPILSTPTLNDLLIGTDVENLNETKNFSLSSIGTLIGQDYVPYIGATGNVDLGIYSIEGSAFIVNGGTASQFLKADGTLDSTFYVPQTRTITINSVGYDLSANRSWDLPTIDSLTTLGTSGAATYIGKVLNIPIYQAQGNYITQLSGEATALGPGNATVTLSNSAVISKVLTGLNITGGNVIATDTILQAFGKVQNQINGLTGGVTYQGTWNAATNTPFLQSSVGTKGYYYVVSVPGTTNLNGITDWQLGDWAIYNGTAWEKVDNTDAVVSVNGYTGAVMLTYSDVGAPPATRTLTINGVGYDLSLDRSWTVGNVRTDQTYADPSWITSLGWSKIINTPTTLAGYGITDGVSTARTLTINGVGYDLTADRTWSVGTVTSVGTTAPLTGGTITGSGTIGITQASAISDGYLSSIDWSTFNSKQNAITASAPLSLVSGTLSITQAGVSSDGYLSSTDWNTFNSKVGGSGTANYLPIWTSSSVLGNSSLSFSLDTLTVGYNSVTGGAVSFTNIGLTPYTYSIQMNNFGSPRSTFHNYTDGIIVQAIASTQVSRMFDNGNFILGTGTTDTGHKLTISGDLYVNTIANAIVDTDRFIVSDGGIIKYRTGAQILTDIGAVSSVGLTMPAAFTVSNSPITSSGTIAVTGAGTAAQYIRGDGTLGDFPGGGGGGGASVSYYLNGSVNQGTFGGNTYYEMNKTPIFGPGTDFNISVDGYVAQFITDVGDPDALLIPGGNWNFETYFSASSGGGSPTFYIELYKYDGTTFTLIASNSTNPELIAFGTTVNPYFSALAVPETVLLATDRLAVRIYVSTSGRTITLHTENSNLCQVITTFTTGLTALNGLTKQVQYFTVGTSGTDFNISSSVATHTFNLPTASAVNRGALSSSDWSTFNAKQNALTLTTSGSSGPATLIGATLNIPDYGSALSGYVPYTGASQAVNLGIYSLSAGSLFVNGPAPTSGSYLGFKQATSVTTGGGGYTSISTFGTSQMNFSFAQPSGFKEFKFDVSSITTGVPGGRVYTMPDADGTIALVGGSGVGTVTSVAALTLGTSGTDLSSTVANSTTTPVITLNVPTASATNRGALSAADWTTFNNKQNALTNPVTGTGTMGQVAYFVGSTAILGSSGLYWDGTNLGIGLAAPAQKLTVNGDVSIATILNATTDTDKFLVSDGGIIKYRTGSEVLSDIGGQAALTNPVTGTGTTNYLPKFTGSTTIGNSQIFDNGSGVGIGGTNTDSLLTINGTAGTTHERFREGSTTIGFIGGANGIITGQNGKLAVRAEAGLVLSSQGNSPDVLITSGNLLVGTTSDNGARLQVSGAIYASDELYLDNGKYLRFRRSSGNLSIQTLGIPSGTDDVRLLTTGDFNVLNGSLTNLMTVKNGGNVGIGTSSPYANLDLGASGANNIILRNTTNAYNLGYIGNSSGRIDIGFSNSNSSLVPLPYLSVNSSGNVLIGTTTDIGDRVNVNGSIRVPQTFFFRYDGDTGLIGSGSSITGGSASQLGIRAASDILFATNGANERMRITSGGNVLIGTTTDFTFLGTTSLNVDRNFNSGHNIRISNQANNSSASANLILGTFGNSWVNGLGSNSSTLGNNLYWAVDASTSPLQYKMVLTTSGNLLVGTTTDNGARLQVSGTATFSSNVAAGSTSSGAQINVFASSYGNNGLFNAYGTDNLIKLQMGALGTNEGFIFTGSGNKISFFSGGNLALTLNSNQTATFSSSVTADSLLVQRTASRNMLGISSIALPTSGAEEGVAVVKTNSNLWQMSLVGYAVDSKGMRVYNTGGAGYTSFEVAQGAGTRFIVDGVGNVGIGTSSPAVSLEVNGRYRTTSSFASSGTTVHEIYNASSSGFGAYIGAGSGTNYSFRVADYLNNPLFTVNGNGNVGIGTTSPIYKFVVSNSGATGLEFDPGTLISNRNQLISYNRSTSAYSQIQIDASLTILGNQGNVLIGNTSAYTSRLTVQAAAGNRPAIKAGFGVVAGNGYWVLGDNYTLDESLTSYGIDYSSGDLVLGSIVAPSTTTSGAFISTQAQFGNLGSAIRAGNSGDIYFFRGTSTSVVAVGGAKSMTESMRLNSSGNVLIGTTTDVGDRVNVNGSIRVPQTFFFRYDGDTGLIGSGSSITGGSASQLGIRAASDILFATNGANERMRITSGGNVWVGNDSNPLLEIANGGSTDVLSGIRWSVGGSRVDYGGIYSATSSANNNYISFYTKNSASAPSERMRITSGGNVLIGTTTDVGARLYVDGAFRTGTLTAGTQTTAVDWRLGNARGGAATNNALIRVQINGVLVDLLGNYV